MRSFGDSPQSGALSPRMHSRLFVQNFSWAVLAFEVMGPFCFKRNYWPSEPQSASRCAGCYRALCRVSKVPVLHEGLVEDLGSPPPKTRLLALGRLSVQRTVALLSGG